MKVGVDVGGCLDVDYDRVQSTRDKCAQINTWMLALSVEIIAH